jgi:hypothetical protein
MFKFRLVQLPLVFLVLDSHHCNAVQRPSRGSERRCVRDFHPGGLLRELLIVGLGPLADAKDADVPLSTAVFLLDSCCDRHANNLAHKCERNTFRLGVMLDYCLLSKGSRSRALGAN